MRAVGSSWTHVERVALIRSHLRSTCRGGLGCQNVGCWAARPTGSMGTGRTGVQGLKCGADWGKEHTKITEAKGEEAGDALKGTRWLVLTL